MCFNVPRGFDMLLGELERDSEFRRIFFDMKLIFYAAAALPKVVWDRLLELSVETAGHAIPLVAAWGLHRNGTARHGLPFPGRNQRQSAFRFRERS